MAFRKTRRNWLILAITSAMVVLGASQSHAAEDFPNKPIRIIVPVTAGGTVDITMRLVAQKMSEHLGQPVIIDNRGGAQTLLGTRAAKSAPNDGYTLLAHANGFSLLWAIKSDAGYKPLTDFKPVGIMTTAPVILEVSGTSEFKSVKELVARAKGQPGALSFASAGVGSGTHIPGAQLARLLNLDLIHVPYQGTGAALPDVASGRVSMVFDGYTSSAPYIASGKMRPLAVSSDKRIAPLPDVPTFKESGIDFSYTLWIGLLAPAGTPDAVIAKLSQALNYAGAQRDLVDRIRTEGGEPAFSSPQEFAARLAREVPAMGKLVEELGIPKQ